MSMDTVDDLEYAEAIAGNFGEAARRVDAALNARGLGIAAWDARVALRVALAAWDTYCRPTCRHRHEDHCDDHETCGCPCGHRYERDACDDDPDGMHHVGCGCE